MKCRKSVLCVIGLLTATVVANENAKDYQKIVEAKYQASVERFKVVDLSPTTKALWFDFQLPGEKSWWGGINVIEVNKEGRPLYWYDVLRKPNGAGIESVSHVKIGENNFLEVIDCSHMGNGSLYLYKVGKGRLDLQLECRAMTNLNVHFSPPRAKVIYKDLNGDGVLDVTVSAKLMKGSRLDKSNVEVGSYRRVYYYSQGRFIEDNKLRMGPDNLVD